MVRRILFALALVLFGQGVLRASPVKGQALETQRKLAREVSLLLDAHAPALPRSMRRFASTVVARSAKAVRTLALTSALKEGRVPSAMGGSVRDLRVMTEQEDWDLRVWHDSGDSPGGPATQSYWLRHQNPWHVLLQGEANQRATVESAEIWVDPIPGSLGVVAVVTEELTTDRLGRQRSVTRGAKGEADGHWLVRTITRTRTTDPETGVRLQGDPGTLDIRYDRYGGDGRRVRLRHDEGEAAWDAKGGAR